MIEAERENAAMHSGRSVQDHELFEYAPSALVVIDQVGSIVRVNRKAEAMLGRAEADLIGRAFATILTEEAGKTHPLPFLAAPDQPGELVLRRGEPEEFTAEVTAGRPGDIRGGLVVLNLRDVTGRKRKEEVLLARSRQQGLVAELGRRALTGIPLVQLMNEAVHTLVSDLGVEYGNLLELLPDGRAVFRAGVGWREDLVGGTTLELAAGTPAGRVVLDQVPIHIEDLRTDDRFRALSVAREHGVVSSLTVPIYGPARPLGVLAVHSARHRLFPEADVHFVQAVANVVATAMERQRDEERLRERQMGRAEQMAAIGQVAAGVAHEIRNPLTSIKGLVQVNLREADARGLPAEDLRVIEHEVRRMERTLQTFLDFARPPRPDRRRLDLTAIVDRVTALVGGRAKKQGVALRFHGPAGATRVDGDQDQLQQLLLNLVLNALDAMPDGGTVEIELRPPRDGQAEMLVRDSGPGVAPDILPKVFETFVSSKETGIGIGLAVSRRIAEDHGGSLSAYNLPAGGACFALRLPVLI
jgi:PAS domain S-box-containing protein